MHHGVQGRAMVGNVRTCRMACTSSIRVCARPMSSPIPKVQFDLLVDGP